MTNKEFLQFCIQGRIHEVQKGLRDPNVQPNFNRNQPIRYAAIFGEPKVVRMLMLDSRVNPADLHNEAINNALDHLRTDIARILLIDKRVRLGPNIEDAKEQYPELFSHVMTKPQSKEEQDKRKPHPPDYYMGGLEDTVHKDKGGFRVAKVNRTKKKLEEQ